MQNIDSLTLKYFFDENFEFINGSVVQKIQQINRYEIILNIRNINLKLQKKLYININPKYPHTCFIDENGIKKRNIKIPSKPPAFCMQLRKYLNGSKIKDFKLIKYERILEFYFDYLDEIGSLTPICLVVELMGKHSNIILYNSTTKIILGSIHNISEDKSSLRVVFGGAKYIYPPLKTSYHLEKPMFEGCNINDAIDKYYSDFMFEDILKNLKSKLKKYLSKEYKKLKKTVEFKPDIKKEEKYKNIGDLIISNLYNPDCNEIFKKEKIEIDNTISLNQNAQKYYALYKKEKTTNIHKNERYNEAKNKLEYFENIIFSIENALNFDELSEIKNEIIELGLINDKKENVSLSLQKLEYKGFEIYVGKNNKQNDYLISKIASNDDYWFHGLNFASSHVILKLPNNKKAPMPEVLEYCAKLVKNNSKAKNSGKVSIIYTFRKNLKKPPNTYPGYVTYKNEKEIVID